MIKNPYAAGSDANTHTYSFWIKRENTGETDYLITGRTFDSTGNYLYFSSDDKLWMGRFDNGSGWIWLATTVNTFTSTTEWYHIVYAFDDTQGTAANRMKFYVNGTLQTFTGSLPTGGHPSWAMNSSQSTNIGYRRDLFGGANPSLGAKMAELYLISGQQLEPTAFGVFDLGKWRPIPYAGTFGSADTYLDFSDTINFGKDASGNGNDFTTSGFTAGSQDTSDTPST